MGKLQREPSIDSTSIASLPVKYIKVSGYILLYYGLSVSLSVFNTRLLGRTQMNFPFPIFAALFYDVIQFLMAFSIMSTSSPMGPFEAFKKIGRKKFFKVILPCAIAAGLDLALSNSSLKYVSLSFYTMVKSSSPMFILIFAFIFGLERASVTLVSIITVIGMGTLLTVYNPTSFDLLGFCLVFSAAIMSGIRWALTQLIIDIQDDEDKSRNADGPLSAILFLTPPIGVTLAVICGSFEGFKVIFSKVFLQASIFQTLLICTFGGIMTFSLILTEYKVVESTSVVTLSISSIVKEIIMIFVSVVYFKDKLLPINYLGLVISIGGIIGYNYHKIRRKSSKKDISQMYLAIPTTEPVQVFLNPFIDDEDEELEDLELARSKMNPSERFIELEVSKVENCSKSLNSLSRNSSTKSNNVLAKDPEAYLKSLKKHWSTMPSLEHIPIMKPSSTNDEDAINIS
mgnify:CR=1 FL=1